MTRWDVFNGDADGLCALHQLRLADPVDARIVTGLKRDIALLKEVKAEAGDEVTVLDVSIERNRPALEALLARGVRVRYFDHHDTCALPKHPNLETHIETSRGVCTSVLVDGYLGGRHRAWAVVGAFGDNLHDTGGRLAGTLGLDAERVTALAELGATLNYNAYGDSVADVLVPPAELYRILRRHADPFELLRSERVVAGMNDERHADLARAQAYVPVRTAGLADAFVLPDAPWSRRVSGAFANRLVLSRPERAYAVITAGRRGYQVSVRTPEACPTSAAEFCRRYAGGGRAAAAGIDRLEPDRLGVFLDDFVRAFAGH